MSLNECAERLSDFGITFNQAKVYIAIAQLGVTSVSQVSKTSNVPREEVYRMLPKLQELGLMEKILGRPIKVKATPIEDALSILIKREQDIALKKVSALIAEKDEFLKNFDTCKMKQQFEEAHFTLVSQREAVIHKGLTMIEAAERAVDIITSRDQFSHFFTNYHEPINKAIRKGVKFRIVLDTAEQDDSILKILEEYESPKPSLYLKYTDQPLSHYTVVDYEEALVATSIEPTALGKNPYLWTNDSNLIGLMAKNFESIWHTSAKIDAVETEDVTEKLINFLKGLTPTNHVLFLYGSSEAKYNVLCNYLKVGLENGEAAVYIATEENPSQTRDAMKRFGIEVEKNEKTGALSVLGYNEFYIMDGKPSILTTVGLIKKLYNEALIKGFKGCRVFGEMACFFEHNLVQELIEYERALQRVLDIPIIGICAYNTNILAKANNPVDLYNELLKAHGTVLFTGLDNKLGRIEIRQA